MGKRKIYWLFAFTFVSLTVGLTALGALAKHEPHFYRESQIEASDTRKELALNFVSNFGQMLADRNANVETWGSHATEAQINCFFEEVFVGRGEAEGLRKLGISSPCVTLGDNQMRLAFRYGSGWFSTVISYELKVWLVPKEANVIAVEIQSARAGAVPISKQSIVPQLTDFARKQNYKVTLYRHEGNPVALIDLESDQQQSKSILTKLQINQNSLVIQGRTLDHAVAPVDPTKGRK